MATWRVCIISRRPRLRTSFLKLHLINNKAPDHNYLNNKFFLLCHQIRNFNFFLLWRLINKRAMKKILIINFKDELEHKIKLLLMGYVNIGKSYNFIWWIWKEYFWISKRFLQSIDWNLGLIKTEYKLLIKKLFIPYYELKLTFEQNSCHI